MTVAMEFKSILTCFIKDDVFYSVQLLDTDPQNMQQQKSVQGVYLMRTSNVPFYKCIFSR